MLKEEILDICDSMITESFDSKINRDIDKVEKALKKANKAMGSSKIQNNPEAKAGAKKVIKALEEKKEELLKIKDEQEAAAKDISEAKSDDAKKKAELRKLKAEKRYQKFQRAKDPINTVCNVLRTATVLTALIGVFVAVSKLKYSSGTGFLSNIADYFMSGGENGKGNNRKINNAVYSLGRQIAMGTKW